MRDASSFSLALRSMLLLPAYLWQGIAVRRRTERLTPPSGPVAGAISGEGEPVRLLVTGDSSAAGVGVGNTSESLACRLAELCASATGRPVTWRIAGFNSAVSAQLRDHVLPHVEPRDFTHVVLCIGTNDAKNWHSPGRFKRDFGGLIYALRARFPAARIVWSPVIDMRAAPALPPLLGAILEMRAELINRKGAELCRERGVIAAPRLPVEGPEGFSVDGFHAGAEGYAYWARHLAPVLFADLETRQPWPPL